MDKQKFEELQSTICHLSKENARLYEAYFEESKKVNDVAECNGAERKRIDELEKMMSNYENEQRMLVDGREKLLKEMEPTGKRLNGQEKQPKLGDTLAKAQEIERNAEMREARKELIDVLLTLSSNNAETMDIGVKNLGQVNFTVFHEEMVKASGRSVGTVFNMASNLCKIWEDKIKNPSWHPFKVVTVEGKTVEIIDDDDEELKALFDQRGEVVYKAVTTALNEINDYNPKGCRNVVPELWNFKEDRRATLKEGIAFVAERYLGQYVQDRICYSKEGPQKEMEGNDFIEMDVSP